MELGLYSLAHVCIGSIATDVLHARADHCPLCSDSDRLPSKRNLSLCANRDATLFPTYSSMRNMLLNAAQLETGHVE